MKVEEEYQMMLEDYNVIASLQEGQKVQIKLNDKQQKYLQVSSGSQATYFGMYTQAVSRTYNSWTGNAVTDRNEVFTYLENLGIRLLQYQEAFSKELNSKKLNSDDFVGLARQKRRWKQTKNGMSIFKMTYAGDMDAQKRIEAQEGLLEKHVTAIDQLESELDRKDELQRNSDLQ